MNWIDLILIWILAAGGCVLGVLLTNYMKKLEEKLYAKKMKILSGIVTVLRIILSIIIYLVFITAVVPYGLIKMAQW